MILRARTLAGVNGEDEVTDEEVRDAVAGLLDAFLGDLLTWALLLALLGLTVEPRPPHSIRRTSRPPASPRSSDGQARGRLGARAARRRDGRRSGILACSTRPCRSRSRRWWAAAFLVFLGTSELLAPLGQRGVSEEAQHVRGRALAGAGVAGALVVGTLVALIVVITGTDPEPSSARRARSGTCNGSFALCDLRLNEAVFAGTHNSFSALDSPDWFIANQRHDIPRQLEDGIRLFLIDAHWGVEDAAAGCAPTSRRRSATATRS